MNKNLSEKLRRELDELKLVADDDIDTSDVAEAEDWTGGLRGLWAATSVEPLNYDVRAVANEILRRTWDRGVRPTNMWLNKVTWFVYEQLLVEFGKLLTPARAEAWDHGPVFREIYGPAKIFKDEPIAALLEAFSIDSKKMEVAEAQLDEATSRLLNEAVAKYAGKTASQLRNLSHIEGSAWYRVWYSGKKTSAGMVISPKVILAAASNRRHDL